MPSLDKRPIPVAERTVVVATALLAGRRLLAAERLTPPAEGGRSRSPDGGPPAGLWELPGGKVEPGEDEAAAVIRECGEELALAVRPVERLAGAWPVGERFLLRVWLAVPEQPPAESGCALPQPSLRVHRQYRWLAPEELTDLPWLPSNRPLVRAVIRRLRSPLSAQAAVRRPGESAAEPEPGRFWPGQEGVGWGVPPRVDTG